jgi:DNA-binding response OmpR family regulator
MTPHVLVVSRDPMLLQTRQLILGAFFEVRSAGRIREAESLMSRYSFDLIILCYTLGESECQAMMNLVAEVKRRPMILVLSPMGRPPDEPVADRAVMMEAGPYYLLKKSAEMLGVDIKAKANLVEV